MDGKLGLRTEVCCMYHFTAGSFFCRARSIGLIRIRRTPPFSDEAFDWAQLNSDESSELIRLIRKTTDEFG